MCILSLLVNNSKALHPDLVFFCVHNRDEDPNRPASDPVISDGFWGGKDLKAGGTWFGFNPYTGELHSQGKLSTETTFFSIHG